MFRHFIAGIVALAPFSSLAGPVPPCDQAALPGYSSISSPPNAQVWTAEQLRAENWQPATCLGWAGQTKVAAAVASAFRSSENVFDRGFAIDTWTELKYWSVSKQAWRPLMLEASAIDSKGQRQGRTDPARLVSGSEVLFVQRDENTGESTYRLRILERSQQRLVISIENVTSVKVGILTAFEPGALQTVTFITKAGADSWNTYQITRVGSGGSSMALSHAGSFLNRLEAVRRYLAGLPSDQLPPLALR